jgi:peptidoglycan/xylan/chitin deacetylase (PgdA/CDA1 family)
MLRVVTYHRIAVPERTPRLNPRLVSATPEVFDQHLRHLARHYRVVSLSEVLEARRRGLPLPRRAVLVTFDDAYRDFLEAAWPRLRAAGLPATLFVPTAYPGDPPRGFWWDRLHRCVQHTRRSALPGTPCGTLPLGTAAARRAALVRLQAHVKSVPHPDGMALVDAWCEALGDPGDDERRVLSWEELRDLARDGLALGAHSRTHPLLTRIGPAQLADEIAGSLQDLGRECGAALPVFSYPSGAHDERVVAAARAAGVELAFTQIDGHNDLRDVDPLRLHRTNITRRTTPAVFRLRLLRWVAYVDRWRHRERRPASAA